MKAFTQALTYIPLNESDISSINQSINQHVFVTVYPLNIVQQIQPLSSIKKNQKYL